MEKKINVLIIDDNKSIIEDTKKYFSNHAVINVLDYALTGKEGKDKILENPNKYDLIVMDIILPFYDGIDILEAMKENNINTKVIIITSYKQENLINKISNYEISYYLLKPFNMEILEKRILQTVVANEKVYNDLSDELKISISKILHNLGVPSHIKGYQYIRESIYLLYQSPNLDKGITKEIYPEIAERYDTTASRVERAIRHAIEISWARGDYELMEDIFGNSIDFDRSKPTNAEFIATITDKLKLDNRRIMV